MIENLRQIKYALLYENNKLSLGRIMVISVFLLMVAIWIAGFISTRFTVPETMLDAFYGLLGYAGGTKIVGVARKAVEKAKTVQQVQKTSEVDSPDA